MKTILLTVSFLLTASLINAQQGKVFGVLSYSPGTCKLQVEYWIGNPTNGNGSFDIAISRVNLQWDSSLLNFVSYTTFTENLDLTPDHWRGTNAQYPEAPDTVYDGNRNVVNSIRTINGTDTTYTYNNKTYQRKVIQRSTDSCNHLFSIGPNESKPIAIAVLQFKNCDSANNYNFYDPNDYNFIGDFANTTDTVSSKKKILFVIDKADRPKEAPGVNCYPGSGGQIKNMDNIPVGADSAKFINTQGPLPVKLRFFSVYKQNNRALLQWETVTEINNAGFEVHRKTNYGFETVGFIPSKGDNGNSNQILKYSFIDPELLRAGVSYYRLKMRGGKSSTYSDIKSLRNNFQPLQVLIYPNPAKSFINVIIPEGNGIMDMALVDFSGRVLKTWKNNKAQTLQLNGLKTGIYSLQINNRENGEKASQKITVLQ
jgi:Secretion system C-terminal sorting domain